MGRYRYNRFGDREEEDDDDFCQSCGALLMRPESIRARKCADCRLEAPLKPPESLADTRSAKRRRTT
jgi:hypothetical protein